MATYNLRNGFPSSLQAGDILFLENNHPDSYFPSGEDTLVVNLPFRKGIYRLECWGAGKGWYHTSNPGAYAYGDMTLNLTTSVWLRCGGTGSTSTYASLSAATSKSLDGKVIRYGGYNGGCNGTKSYYDSTGCYTYPSCGRTDIRIITDNFDHTIICAGGAGVLPGRADSSGGTRSTYYQTDRAAGQGWIKPIEYTSISSNKYYYQKQQCASDSHGGLTPDGFYYYATTGRNWGNGSSQTSNWSHPGGAGGGGWLGGIYGSYYDGGTSQYNTCPGEGGSSFVWCELASQNTIIPSTYALTASQYLKNANVCGGRNCRIYPLVNGTTRSSLPTSINGFIRITVLSTDTTMPLTDKSGTRGGIYFHPTGTRNVWEQLDRV